MINPTKQANRVEVDGLPGERRQFTIKASGKAFRVLMDGLYEDKVAAPVREIISNAYDAHAAAGKSDVPIKVTAPTHPDPTFRVRDFGVSMDHETVMAVYSQLFNSTKENTNDEVGMFGLGSKSPFAYTDTFSVTTFLNGEKHVYVAHISDDDIPQITHIVTEPQLDEEQGVEVAIPVKTHDVARFHHAINLMIMASDVRPEVDGIPATTQPSKPVLAGEDWVTGRGWRVFKDDYRMGQVAVRQGCVIYPVKSMYVDELAYGYTLVVDVPIGSVEVTASRESLSLNDETTEVVKRHVVMARKGIREWVQGLEFKNRLDEFKKRNDYSFLNNPVGRVDLHLTPDQKNPKLVGQSIEVFTSKRKTAHRSFFKTAGKGKFKLIVVDPNTKVARFRLRASEYYEQHRYQHAQVGIVTREALPRIARLLDIHAEDVISASALPDVKIERAKGQGGGQRQVPKAAKGKLVVIKASTKKLKSFDVGGVKVESMDDMFNDYDKRVPGRGWQVNWKRGIGPTLRALDIKPEDVIYLTEKQAESQGVKDNQLLLTEITKRAHKWAKEHKLQETLDNGLNRLVFDDWNRYDRVTKIIAMKFNFPENSYQRNAEQDTLVDIGREMAEIAVAELAPDARSITEVERSIAHILGMEGDVTKVTLTTQQLSSTVESAVEGLSDLAKEQNPLRFLVRQYLNNNTEESSK